MTRAVTMAASAMALALAGTVVWECLDAPAADASPVSPRSVVASPSSRPEAPEARRGRMEARTASTLARPLFNRIRWPP